MTPGAASILAVTAISLVSLTGLVVLSLRPATLRGGMLVLVSFAAGSLLGDTFFHLLPEMAEEGFGTTASVGLLGGVVGFFILEKVLHWHHAHFPTESVVHPVAATNIVGDAVHNLVDGAIVAGSFLVSTKLGIATAVAVFLHEVPQEIGDFAILLHAGLKPRRALALNVMSASCAIVGAVVALVAGSVIGGVERILVPVTAGGFVYIASSDLIPELQREVEPVKGLLQVVGILAGAGIMAALLALE